MTKSKGGGGNPYHAKDGKFTTSSGAAIPPNLSTKAGFKKASVQEVHEYYKAGGSEAHLKDHWKSSGSKHASTAQANKDLKVFAETGHYPKVKEYDNRKGPVKSYGPSTAPKPNYPYVKEYDERKGVSAASVSNRSHAQPAAAYSRSSVGMSHDDYQHQKKMRQGDISVKREQTRQKDPLAAHNARAAALVTKERAEKGLGSAPKGMEHLDKQLAKSDKVASSGMRHGLSGAMTKQEEAKRGSEAIKALNSPGGLPGYSDVKVQVVPALHSASVSRTPPPGVSMAQHVRNMDAQGKLPDAHAFNSPDVKQRLNSQGLVVSGVDPNAIRKQDTGVGSASRAYEIEKALGTAKPISKKQKEAAARWREEMTGHPQAPSAAVPNPVPVKQLETSPSKKVAEPYGAKIYGPDTRDASAYLERYNPVPIT